MRLVPPDWSAEMLDEHHSLFKIHGQTLCTFDDPRCRECPLLARCPFGQMRVVSPTSPEPVTHSNDFV